MKEKKLSEENISTAEESSASIEQKESGAKISKNKKIRNATATTIDGIKFKSKLEGYMYSKLKELNLLDITTYEPQKIELQPKFELYGKKYQPITWTPDFVMKIGSKTIFLETKGFGNNSWPMKMKMILYWIYLNHLVASNPARKYELHIFKNQKEINNYLKRYIDNDR